MFPTTSSVVVKRTDDATDTSVEVSGESVRLSSLTILSEDGS